MRFDEATAEVAAKVRAEFAYQGRQQAALVPVLKLSQAAVNRRLRGHVPFGVAELIAVARLLEKPLDHFLPSESAQAVPA